MVVEFPDPVVAGVGSGESAEETVRLSKIREQLTSPIHPRADRGPRCGASGELQADATYRDIRGLQGVDPFHPARRGGVGDAGPAHLRSRCWNRYPPHEPDERTQTLISSKEEELIFLDWSAYDGAKLLQLGRGFIALTVGNQCATRNWICDVEIVPRIPAIVAAECIGIAVK